MQQYKNKEAVKKIQRALERAKHYAEACELDSYGKRLDKVSNDLGAISTLGPSKALANILADNMKSEIVDFIRKSRTASTLNESDETRLIIESIGLAVSQVTNQLRKEL